MCATKTNASAITVLNPKFSEQIWAARALIVLVDAFREALAMRRSAQSKYLLNDE